MGFIMSYLTFLYISFAILFCQKKVKKICKYVIRVFFNKAIMTCGGRHGRYAFFCGEDL